MSTYGQANTVIVVQTYSIQSQDLCCFELTGKERKCSLKQEMQGCGVMWPFRVLTAPTEANITSEGESNMQAHDVDSG